MLLKTSSIPNSQMAQVIVFATEIGKEFTMHEKKCVLEFDLEQLPCLLEAVPELRRRPWLFDASNDVVEAEAKYFVTTNKTELWFSFNDLEKDQVTVLLSDTEMAELIDDCNLATLSGGKLQIDSLIGRDYSGEEQWETVAVTVYDVIEAHGNDSKEMKKIFVAWLLRFGQNWLQEISKN